jgi:hypothetical protein
MHLARPLCLLLTSLACAAPALAADDRAQAFEAFRKEAQTCKASPTQPDIGVEMKPVAGKSAAEDPATPDELERVKRLLAKSNLPFDTVNHRATFEFTLALVRVKRVAAFKVPQADAQQDAKVRDCLARLAADVGLESLFE